MTDGTSSTGRSRDLASAKSLEEGGSMNTIEWLVLVADILLGLIVVLILARRL